MKERTGGELVRGIGRALRFLREQRGRKQKDVADAAGIGRSRLSNIESEGRSPNLFVVSRILETLDYDLHDLHNALAVVQGQYPKICDSRVSGIRLPATPDTSCSSGPPKGKGRNGP